MNDDRTLPPPASEGGDDAAAGHPAADSGHVAAGHGDQRTYSPRAVMPDGTYAGRPGGYGGPPSQDDAQAGYDPAQPGRRADGDGTYGYPYGPGVGDTGGRHPDDEARALPPAEEDLDPLTGPGDRFGAGRTRGWIGHRGSDPTHQESEYTEYRSEHARQLDDDYNDWLRQRGHEAGESFEAWRARRRRAGSDGAPR